MGRYRSIKSGVILWRKSFKVISWLTPFAYGGVAAFAALDGFRRPDVDALRGVALVLIASAGTYSLTRSRVHLMPTGILVVNCMAWHEIPYDFLHKAEGGRGRGLVMYVKGASEGDAEVYSIGFAGSLVDQHFRTAERAAREINKAKKRARGKSDSGPAVRRGIVRDAVVEMSVLMAFGFSVTSFFVGG
jgi:hypothetical protein